jgi:predicted permease
MNRLLSAVRNLVKGRDVDRETEAELRSYLAFAADQHQREGLSPEDAARAAGADMGSVLSVREQVFAARAAHQVDILGRDLLYGWRVLWRHPLTAGVAIFSLAVGIGANTAIFAVVDALMLRPLPVRDPAALVSFQRTELDATPSADILDDAQFAYPEFQAYAAERRAFADAAAVLSLDRSNIRMGHDLATDGRRTRTALVSGEYFSTLGVEAALGRVFGAQDDVTLGGHPVAVISDAYWRRRFTQGADVVGRRLELNNVAYTIVGVTPAGFVGDWVTQPTDLWIPMAMQAQVMVERPNLPPRPPMPFVRVIARLQSGVSLHAATAAVNTIYLARRGPVTPDPRMTPREYQDAVDGRLALRSLARGFSPERGSYGRALEVTAGVVGLVLLIACANVASLLLARAAAREHEIGLRLAIGAGPGRLVRQLLTESALLSAMGGIVACVLAWWAAAWLASMLSSAGALSLDVRADARMFGAAAVLAFSTGLLFGLAPALTATRPRLAGVLMGRGDREALPRFRTLRGLVVAQVAVSVVLIVAAVLLVRTLQNLRAEGLDPERGRVLTAWIPASQAGHQGGMVATDIEAIREQVARVPGVLSVSASGTDFFSDRGGESPVIVPGHVRTDDEAYFVRWNLVTPGFFDTMHIPLVAGRDFRAEDREGAPRVAIINEAMAREYFGPAPAVGRRFGMRRDTGTEIEIIGVAANAAFDSPRSVSDRVIYLPYRQDLTHLSDVAVFVRSTRGLAETSRSLRAIVQQTDPALPIAEMTTMDAALDRALVRERLVADVSAAFATMAVLLTSVGIFGVMAYLTSRRVAELGVRQVLGASRQSILALVLRDAWLLCVAGIVLGTPLALATDRAIAGQLFHVSPTGLAVVGLAAVLMLGVAAAATILPAIRATRVDPLVALRHQ